MTTSSGDSGRNQHLQHAWSRRKVMLLRSGKWPNRSRPIRRSPDSGKSMSLDTPTLLNDFALVFLDKVGSKSPVVARAARYLSRLSPTLLHDHAKSLLKGPSNTTDKRISLKYYHRKLGARAIGFHASFSSWSFAKTLTEDEDNSRGRREKLLEGSSRRENLIEFLFLRAGPRWT